jgi:hypothetical protein
MSTATINPVPPIRPAEPAPAVRRAVDIDFGPRQSFEKLLRVELRKMIDTRSGRWLVAAILGLAVITLGWRLTHLDSQPVDFATLLDQMLMPVDIILPVLGIMAMTSEWTQRTALTTFTLTPRRLPVLAAKLTAAIALALSLVAAVAVLALAGTALGGAIGGHGSGYDHLLRQLGGSALADVLNIVMAAGIGLVAMVTAVGVLIFYVLPTAWALVGPALLHDNSAWLDVFQTFDRLSSFDLTGHVGPTVTSLAAWIVVPVVVGTFLANRREVK